MQKVSRVATGLTVATGAVAIVALAVSGGGPGEPVDTGRCLAIYFYLMQALVLALIVCLLRCDDDGKCQVRCIHLFLYLFIVVELFLISCLLGSRYF